MMKRKNVADELVAAMREAAEIAEGHVKPAAVYQFPLALDVDVRAVRAGTDSAGRSLRGGLRLTPAPCRTGNRDGGVRTAPRGRI